MPNIKSAKKRVLVSRAENAANRSEKAALKTQLKKFDAAVAAGKDDVQEVYREEVTLSAKPLDMPREVVIDVTDLELGKSIRASEVKLPEGVSIVYKNDFNMVSVISPDAAPEEAAAEA